MRTVSLYLPVLLIQLAIIALIVLQHAADARASYFPCNNFGSWIGGADTNYATDVHPTTFTTGGTATCSLSIDPPLSDYRPGEVFTVTIKASGRSGFKISANSGTWASAATNGIVNGQCVDYDKSKVATAAQQFIAPSSGTVSMVAICETKSGPAYVSNRITLPRGAPTPPPVGTRSPFTLEPTTLSPTTASPTTAAPVTDSPFTSGPTVFGETRKPTVSPTVRTRSPTQYPTTKAPTTLAPSTLAPSSEPSAAPITSSPTYYGQSLDPAYVFEWPLDDRTILRYSVDPLYAKFKLIRNGTGYLGFGPGDLMLGSKVLVGMSGTYANGLYTLNSKTAVTGGISDVAGAVATTTRALQAFGISDFSFSMINDETIMSFTLERARQRPEFTLVESDGTCVNVLIAAGPDSSHGVFCSAETCYAHGPADALVLMDLNFEYAPGEAPYVPRPAKLTQALVIHIITMLLGWGFFVPLGIIIPLFNNIKYSPKRKALCGVSGPMWLKYHWVLQCIGLVLTYVGTAYGYIEAGVLHWQDPHGQIGLFLLIVSIIQPAYAFMRPARKTKELAKKVARRFFDYLHVPFGYAIAFIAMAENLTGVQEIQDISASGTDRYLFLGMRGAVGFAGPMGLAIVLLSTIMYGTIAMGLLRALITRCRPKQPRPLQKAVEVEDPAKPFVTMEQIALHTTQESFWTIYKGKVYDITPFLNSHPAGKKLLLPYAGKDMTEAYEEVGHSAQATAMFDKFYIGELATPAERPRSASQRPNSALYEQLQSSSATSRSATVAHSDSNGSLSSSMSSSEEEGTSSSSSTPPPPSTFLEGNDNKVRRQVQLASKVVLSHNTFSLKFVLPEQDMVLGLPIGKHIAIYAPNVQGTVPGQWNNAPDPELDAEEIQRKFTPISCDELDVGYFELVVKIYRPCPQFPDGGKMSLYLDSLQEGAFVQVAGPFGTHQYLGRGRFKDGARELLFNEVAMIAGGSGIAPMMQVFTAMLRDPLDYTRVSLIFANSSVDDILLKDKLDVLAEQYPERLKIWYTVSQDPKAKDPPPTEDPKAKDPPPTEDPTAKDPSPTEEWTYSVGRLTAEMLLEHLPVASPNTTIAIMSGPQPMMDHASRLLQDHLGYSEDVIVEY